MSLTKFIIDVGFNGPFPSEIKSTPIIRNHSCIIWGVMGHFPSYNRQITNKENVTPEVNNTPI